MVVNTVDDGGSNVTDWFRSLPIVSRYWFGMTVALTLAGNFGIIDVSYLIWDWRSVRAKFELWRVVTSFCYAGGFQFNTLVKIYMLHSMSTQYEKAPFNTGGGGGTADYIFAMMFGSSMILLTYPLVSSMFPIMPLFCNNLVYFVMYVWSKKNPSAQANIYGIPIPGIWLPFVYLALTVFTGGAYFDLIHGLVIGHLYYFLADVVPQVQGRDVLVTPSFLLDRFGVGQYQPEAVNAGPQRIPGQPPAPTPGAAGGYQWAGTGRRLGRD